MTSDYDVVVVGGGGAGLTAAATARAAGASVLLLEGSRALGGSTAVASGSFLAAGTDVQRAAGVVGDGPDALFRFWMNACQWIANPAIVRRYCDEAPAALAWLADHGVPYSPELLRATPLADVARVHRPEGGGQAIVDALARTCREWDVDIALANKVDRLVLDDGAVAGVESGGEVVAAGVVVMTTGGFARNAELLAAHFPDTSIAGEDLWSPAPDTCQGEGLRMALAAGAATDGDNRGEMVLSNGLVRDFEPYRPGWPIFVNSHGRRFVSETAPNAAMLRIFREQVGPVWAVFDEAARAGRRHRRGRPLRRRQLGPRRPRPRCRRWPCAPRRHGRSPGRAHRRARRHARGDRRGLQRRLPPPASTATSSRASTTCGRCSSRPSTPWRSSR